MDGIEIGARVSEYDQTLIPLFNRDGGPSWRGGRAYGTIVGVSDSSVDIEWDRTAYWDLGVRDHSIEEIGDNIRIEKPEASTSTK
ncbi:MAG: hypothetical protein AAFP77_19630 [Bacteroidota bacterium]